MQPAHLCAEPSHWPFLIRTSIQNRSPIQHPDSLSEVEPWQLRRSWQAETLDIPENQEFLSVGTESPKSSIIQNLGKILG